MNPILERFVQYDTPYSLSLNLLLHLGLETADGESALIINDKKTLVLPDNVRRLVNLIQDDSTKHRTFLAGLARRHLSSRYQQRSSSRSPWSNNLRKSQGFDFSPILFCEQINKLTKSQKIQWIDNEAPHAVFLEAFANAFNNPLNDISLSPVSNFVRDFYVDMLTWSDKNFTPILTHSISLFDKIGLYLPTLQLPVDAMIQGAQMKQDLVSSALTMHPALPLAKFFVGISMVAGSNLPCVPEKLKQTANVLGAVIAFTDP